MMLIIFGGLPGSGKTTIALSLAEKLDAVYLRIDTIETAIRKSSLCISNVQESGYLVGYEIAKDNLKLGQTVVADSVNPVEVSRQSWRDVAIKENKQYLEIEVICSDKKEHQNRIDNRNLDSHDTTPITTWQEIINREYNSWDTINLQLDTFKMGIEDCVKSILKEIKRN